MADLKTVIQAMKKTKIITENKKLPIRGIYQRNYGVCCDVEFYLTRVLK